MNIVNSLRNFIEDNNYYISFFNNNIYINKYELIMIIKSNVLKIKFSNFIIEINGTDLKITKMSREELLISGIIKGLSFIYE